MKKRIFGCVIFVLLIACGVGAYFLFSPTTDTKELVGRNLNIRAQGKEQTYVYFVDEDTAHFSSDVGNEVEYSRRGETLVFLNVYFFDQQYDKLYAKIVESSYQDTETFQYYSLAFYSNSKCEQQIAYTYPDDTLVEKVDILKTFTATEFEQVSHDAPNFLPDEHENDAQISDIDQIALNLFEQTVSISFESNFICKAVLKNGQTLTGKYAHFMESEIYLNFGQLHSTNHLVIKMKVYDGIPNPTPRYYGGEETGTYDPNYSNLTPPPYYSNNQTSIYWECQDSTFIIR